MSYTSTPKLPGGVKHLDTNPATTTLSLELGNLKGLWKKLIESEKSYQNITKILGIPGNGSYIISY